MEGQSVAVIGIGAMGAPMAMRIHEAGFRLIVCDRDQQARQPFEALGVQTTDKASDCAGCDVVIVLVATPDQVRSVIFAKDGLISGLSAVRPTLVVMGTVTPQLMQELAIELQPHGVHVIDAPVSGGVVKARDGTLAIIMGGPAELCEELRPLMQAMGSSIFHCGALGAGQTTKIVNNIVGISMLMISAEAYRIGLDNGLVLPDAVPVFEAGTGRSFLTGHVGDAAQAYSAWAATRKDFDSLHAILRKDIELALAVGEQSGPLPMIRGLQDVLSRVGDETFENWLAVAATPSVKT